MSIRETVPDMLAHRVALSPEAVAFRSENAPGQWHPVTWAEFAARVGRLRRGLLAVGLRPGDHLVIIAPVSLEWELLHHAALSLGVVVAGMDGHDLPTRIAAMVELADIAAFAVADPGVLAEVSSGRWARCRLALQLGPGPAAWPASAAPITAEALEAQGAAADLPEVAGPRPEDAATIIFTSGTTGDPKGIAYRHEQVCLAIRAICDAFPFVGPGSRLLCWLPLSNLFQRIVNLAGMRSGAASFLLGDPRRVMDVVGGVAPDVFVGVPRFYEKLYEGVRQRLAALPMWQRRLVDWAWETGRQSSPSRQRFKALPLGLRFRWAIADRAVLRRIRAVMGDRLQCMVTGSAPIPVYLLEEFHALGWLVLEAYGMSENVMPMAMNRPDRFRFGTVGRVMPGNDVAISEGGAVKVRGPGLFSGYLAGPMPELDGEGYYTTGDLGRFDVDGFLRLEGRAADFLKTSTGRRIAPTPIEWELQRIDGVDQVVVVGNGRKQLAALATVADGQVLEADARRQLEGRIRERLAAMSDSDRPALVILQDRPLSIDSGELTPNLKIRRAQVEFNYREVLDRAFGRLEALKGSGGAGTLILWQPPSS